MQPVADLPLHRRLGLTDGELERITADLGREPNAFELAVYSLLWSEHCGYKHSRLLLRRLPTDGPRVLQGPGENAGRDRRRRRPRGGVQGREPQPPVGGRALPGRGHRRRRDPARHLRDGRAADRGARLAPLRLARQRAPAAPVRRHRPRHRPLRQLRRRPERRRRDRLRRRLPREPAWSTRCASACSPRRRARARARRGRRQPGRAVRRDRPGATGSAAPACWPPRTSTRRAPTSVPRCRWATRSPARSSSSARSSSPEGPGRLAAGPRRRGPRVLDRRDGREAAASASSSTSTSCRCASGHGAVRDHDLRVARSAWPPWSSRGGSPRSRPSARRWELPLHRDRPGRRRRPAALPVARRRGRRPAGRALADDAPLPARARRPTRLPDEPIAAHAVPPVLDARRALLQLLCGAELCSKRWVYEQYDQLVGSGRSCRPGGDAAVVRLTPSDRAIALALDGDGRPGGLDPRRGGCGRSRGGAERGLRRRRPAGDHRLPELRKPRAARAAVAGRGDRGHGRGLRALGIPVVSGNVSLYNETPSRAIHPTPVVGAGACWSYADPTRRQPLRRAGRRSCCCSATPGPVVDGSEYQARGTARRGRIPESTSTRDWRLCECSVAARERASCARARRLRRRPRRRPRRDRLGAARAATSSRPPRRRDDMTLFGEGVRPLVVSCDERTSSAWLALRPPRVPSASARAAGREGIGICAAAPLDRRPDRAGPPRPAQDARSASDGPLNVRGLRRRRAGTRRVAPSFFALYALQHRGQESAGIAVRDGGHVTVQGARPGRRVFDEPA